MSRVGHRGVWGCQNIIEGLGLELGVAKKIIHALSRNMMCSIVIVNSNS